MRNTKLNELLRPNDDEAAVQLKMLAVLAKQRADIDKLLLHAFSQLDPANPDGDEPVEALYGFYLRAAAPRPRGPEHLERQPQRQAGDAPERFEPGDDDSYELIERFMLPRLLQRFQGNGNSGGQRASDAELVDTIRARATSC